MLEAADLRDTAQTAILCLGLYTAFFEGSVLRGGLHNHPPNP